MSRAYSHSFPSIHLDMLLLLRLRLLSPASGMSARDILLPRRRSLSVGQSLPLAGVTVCCRPSWPELIVVSCFSLALSFHWLGCSCVLVCLVFSCELLLRKIGKALPCTQSTVYVCVVFVCFSACTILGTLLSGSVRAEGTLRGSLRA